MRKVLLPLMLLFLSTFLACDEPAKPKRPPADSVSETDADDPRERRRNASENRDLRIDDDRYSDTGAREERRRPPIDDRESSAAEEAEDERDADADRPVSQRKD